jgi:hypothetical protein
MVFGFVLDTEPKLAIANIHLKHELYSSRLNYVFQVALIRHDNYTSRHVATNLEDGVTDRDGRSKGV